MCWLIFPKLARSSLLPFKSNASSVYQCCLLFNSISIHSSTMSPYLVAVCLRPDTPWRGAGLLQPPEVCCRWQLPFRRSALKAATTQKDMHLWAELGAVHIKGIACTILDISTQFFKSQRLTRAPKMSESYLLSSIVRAVTLKGRLLRTHPSL